MILKRTAGLMTLTVLLVSVYIYNHHSGHTDGYDLCSENKNQCIRSSGLHVSFDPSNIPLEEEVKVSLITHEDFEIQNAWVEGVNMFMGKIPLLIETESDSPHNRKSAILFLGSCSEPRMHWRLFVEVEDVKSDAKRTLLYEFLTER